MARAVTQFSPRDLTLRQQSAIVMYVQNCVESLANTWNLRNQFLLKDQLYYRELDRTVEQNRAILANAGGDAYKLQNLQVPIAMPQVESALAYLAGVFLSGYPIFGVSSNPANQDVALQMESIMADNSQQYGWVRQLLMFMRDGLKYNLGAVEVAWKTNRIYTVGSDSVGNANKQEIMYAGNQIKRLDPYNLIFDKRVLQPAEHHIKGEFGGYTELMSRIALKQFLLDLGSTNTINGREAFQSGTPSITVNGGDSWYYIPQVNSTAFLAGSTLPTTNWLAWAMLDGQQGNNNSIEYNNMYEVTTLYGKIIPQDFTLTIPQRNQPQIWKFIVINRKVLVYVEQLPNVHNYLPILIAQPTEDGLGYQTKSFLDNAAPFQFLSTSLWNAVLESKRRRVFDRLLYDPSRVRKEDIDKVSSVARIPVKQSAYGKPLGEAVYPFPYHDENSAADIQIAAGLGDMADIANGQNRVQRGQFQKGNKTRTEFVETMSNSNSRQQLQAKLLEDQTFTPMKLMLKLNIMQFQGKGTIYNAAAQKDVAINPIDLRTKAVEFKVSDGLLPTDKLMSMDVFSVFMQTVQSSPLMQSEFDVVSAFVYWCKVQGATWLNDFVRTPQQQAAVMQQLTAHEQAKRVPPGQPGAEQQPPQGAPNAGPGQ